VNKKKHSTQEILATSVIESTPDETASEEDPTLVILRGKLEEISKLEGVTGYILRNATSAVIDLKEPENLVSYALLSSQAEDASREFSEMFKLGEIENVVLEGEDSKMLCANVNEAKISVFMEKAADHSKIIRRIRQ
jgi:predicted regulator of Ras-like GTPase activity (Roadblock/LC7/MglB family)